MKYIELTQGYRAVVDDDMYEYLNQWKWCFARGWAMRRVYTGTGRSNDTGYSLYMHNLVIPPSKGKIIDHISRDGLDNRRSNLRECTQQQNNWNRGVARNNTSGFKGVTWIKKISKWRSRITIDGRLTQLGYFKTKEEAAKAYNEAAKQYFGEYAKLNNV